MTRTEAQEFIRFWSEAEDRGHATPCWVWQRSRTGSGYGVAKALGQTSAHRVSYVAFIGDIAPGHVVCHSCDVPTCVNPDHLWSGTQLENIRDTHAKGRATRVSGIRPASSCPKGHEYTPENTAHSGGFRKCKKCARDKRLRHHARGGNAPPIRQELTVARALIRELQQENARLRGDA